MTEPKERVTLTAEQGIECARMYVAGMTLVEIARCMPGGKEQIRWVVRRAGVRMRKPGPRPGRAVKPKGTR